MLQDVAVIRVLSLAIEHRLEPRDLARVRDQRVLGAGLPRFGAARDALHVHALDDFELHQVHVNRMRVFREIVQFPDLGRTRNRVLGDRLHPA